MVYNSTKKYHTIFRKLAPMDLFTFDSDGHGPYGKAGRASYQTGSALGLVTVNGVDTSSAVTRFEPVIVSR